jgi:hypothetical protein
MNDIKSPCGKPLIACVICYIFMKNQKKKCELLKNFEYQEKWKAYYDRFIKKEKA